MPIWLVWKFARLKASVAEFGVTSALRYSRNTQRLRALVTSFQENTLFGFCLLAEKKKRVGLLAENMNIYHPACQNQKSLWVTFVDVRGELSKGD